MELFFLLIGIVFLGIIFLKITQKFSPKLSPIQKKNIAKHLSRIRSLSPKEKIMELDKLLDHTLACKKYTGNMGGKLKKAGKILQNENATWRAHKIRNKLAHEIGYHPSQKEPETSIFALTKEIEAFL